MKALLTMTNGHVRAMEAFRLDATTNAWLARIKNVVLLVAAPFIGLVYVLAFPLVGLAMLAWMGVRALPERVKNFALFFAAPFIGLAYAIAFPFIGLAMLVGIGARAMVK